MQSISKDEVAQSCVSNSDCTGGIALEEREAASRCGETVEDEASGFSEDAPFERPHTPPAKPTHPMRELSNSPPALAPYKFFDPVGSGRPASARDASPSPSPATTDGKREACNASWKLQNALLSSSPGPKLQVNPDWRSSTGALSSVSQADVECGDPLGDIASHFNDSEMEEEAALFTPIASPYVTRVASPVDISQSPSPDNKTKSLTREDMDGMNGLFLMSKGDLERSDAMVKSSAEPAFPKKHGLITFSTVGDAADPFQNIFGPPLRKSSSIFESLDRMHPDALSVLSEKPTSRGTKKDDQRRTFSEQQDQYSCDPKIQKDAQRERRLAKMKLQRVNAAAHIRKASAAVKATTFPIEDGVQQGKKELEEELEKLFVEMSEHQRNLDNNIEEYEAFIRYSNEQLETGRFHPGRHMSSRHVGR